MQDSITLENGDIVTYPINEGTKSERLTYFCEVIYGKYY